MVGLAVSLLRLGNNRDPQTAKRHYAEGLSLLERAKASGAKGREYTENKAALEESCRIRYKMPCEKAFAAGDGGDGGEFEDPDSMWEEEEDAEEGEEWDEEEFVDEFT